MTNPIPYTPPSYNFTAFNCPHCDAYAEQQWGNPRHHVKNAYVGMPEMESVCCGRCGKFSIWYQHKLIWPLAKTAPPPNPDMPKDVKAEYGEAREILSKSPKASAALLRLAIQRLCVHLGEKGKKINDDIGNLVKKGLPVRIQQALDSVRVVGNNAVHPGQIDLHDKPKIANTLFELVNIITQVMISDPKTIEDIYKQLPESKKEAIKKRDNKKPMTTTQVVHKDLELNGFTATVLAELADISISGAYRILVGERMPGRESLARIAEVVGMSMDDLHKELKRRRDGSWND